MSLRQDLVRLARQKPELREAIRPLLHEAATFNTSRKAKVGDTIQSFNVTDPPSTRYPNFIGIVTAIKTNMMGRVP